MFPLLLLLGLGLAVALGSSSPEIASKSPGLPPLPKHPGPPSTTQEAEARQSFLRKLRPDASVYADGYATKTYYVKADYVSGKWYPSQPGEQFAMYVDEYGRKVSGVSGDPLGTMLAVAGYALPFVPGVGPAAAAALAAAVAFGKGESLKDAALKAARNAIPGGAAAQMGFDLAVAAASGQPIDEAAKDAFLEQVPGAKEAYQKAQAVLG